MLRRLECADAVWLAAVHAACFPNPWTAPSFAELLAQETVFGLGIENVAFGLFQRAAEDMELLTIAVVPAHRRQGIARQMMETAMSLRGGEADAAIHATTGKDGLLRNNVPRNDNLKIFLDVAAGNVAAIALYEALGFTPIRTRKAYYSTGEDAVVMQKTLD